MNKEGNIPHSALIRRSAGEVGEPSADTGLKLVNVGVAVSELRCCTGCSLWVVVPCMVLGDQDVVVVVLVVSMVMGVSC